MKLVLRNPSLRATAIRTIQSIPATEVWDCDLRPHKSTRSLEQNARMWAMLNDISEQVIWYGRKLSPGDWKHVFTASAIKQEVVPGLDGGFVVLGYHTSRMCVREMSDLMEIMSAFGAERGVRFTDTHTPELTMARRD